MPGPFAYNWTHSVYILHPFASFLGIKSGPLAVVRPTITNPSISTKLASPPPTQGQNLFKLAHTKLPPRTQGVKFYRVAKLVPSGL